MASVDVVVTCYEYGRYLRDCVTSVLNQNAPNLRVLIIDNASTDDSAEIARQMAQEDKRVSVIARQQNLGRNASYNDAIDWAAADYFVLLDADDLLAPNALKRAIAIMEERKDLSFTYGLELRLSFPAGVVPPVPDDRSVAKWEISNGREFIEGLCRTAVCHVGPTSVVRRTSTQKAVGYYRPELRFTDDFEMFLRLALAGNVAYTPSAQAIRRIHATQLSSYYTGEPLRDFTEREAAFRSFFEHEGGRIANCAYLKKTVRQSLSDQAYWSGLSHICRRHPRVGYELLCYAWSRSPRSMFFPPLGRLRTMESPFTRLFEVTMESLLGRPYGRFARVPTVEEGTELRKDQVPQ